MFDFTSFEYHSDLFGMGNYSFIRSDETIYIVDWKKVGFYSSATIGV